MKTTILPILPELGGLESITSYRISGDTSFTQTEAVGQHIVADIASYRENDLYHDMFITYQTVTEIVNNARWHGLGKPFTIGVLHGPKTFSTASTNANTYFRKLSTKRKWEEGMKIVSSKPHNPNDSAYAQHGQGIGNMSIRKRASTIFVDTLRGTFYFVQKPSETLQELSQEDIDEFYEFSQKHNINQYVKKRQILFS